MSLKNGDLTAAMKSTGGAVDPAAGPNRFQCAVVLRGYLSKSGNRDPNGTNIWRIYLSARRDVYVDFLAKDAIQVAPYVGVTTDAIPGAVTIWLDTVPVPKFYFISKVLQAPSGFVSGELLEDAMSAQEAHAEAWPEQQYGLAGWPRTGGGCAR
jgi:hypothetical protein